jgi:ABC-type antimicrobial peptide transport system permease subunit
VLRQGGALAMTGVAIGLTGAAVLTRLLRGMLFGIEPLDAATFSLGATLVLSLAVLACLLPARRAVRVDPVIALRNE